MVYQKYFPIVLSWIRQNNGTKDDAYDVFQECLETLIMKVRNLDSNLGGLILQISKRKWLDQLRKKTTKTRVINSIGERHIEEGIEETYITKEKEYLKSKLLESAFVQLSTLCQELLTLYKKGKSVEFIQSNLNLASNNTVYRRKSACIERWSQLIKEDKLYKNYFR